MNPEQEPHLRDYASWEPMYPFNLMDSRSIHLYIPHMPLSKTDTGNWTLPIGKVVFDEEPALVGLLVHRSIIDPELFDLRILLNEGADYPRSTNWTYERPEGIKGFIFESKNPVFAEAVKPYSHPGEFVTQPLENLLALRGIYLETVQRAEEKLKSYHGEVLLYK